MSLRTCKYCNEKYNDNWNNWISKYCCKNCYRNKKTLFRVGDKIYTYNDKMLPERKGLEAIVATGEIIKIHEIYHPGLNGLWDYTIKIPDKSKMVNRFEHQVFNDLEKAIEFVRIINYKRIIMREAKNQLKNI